MKYKAIWQAFLDKTEEEFAEFHHYGAKEIKKIGIKKFIKAMGWTEADDVFKWKTDKLHIMPCPACGKEFGVFDDVYLGLCNSCFAEHDTDKFFDDLLKHGSTPEKFVLGMQLFMTDRKLRNQYKRKVS